MHGLWREGGKADRDVLGSFSTWRAIANSLTWQGDDGLAGVDLLYALGRFDAQCAAQDDRDFLKLRLLRRFLPATGRNHAGDAHLLVTGGNASDEFFDPLGLVARGRDNAGAGDKSGHGEADGVNVQVGIKLSDSLLALAP